MAVGVCGDDAVADVAQGDGQPFLFSNQGFSIRKLGIKVALELAVGLKPEKGTINENDRFHSIGG